MGELYEVDRKNITVEPVHPGELLTDVAESAHLTVTELAKRLRLSRQTVYNITTKKSGVSAEMALRIGKLFGNGPNVWINMQKKYDLWSAKNKFHDEIDLIEKIAA
jgi:addiction module HigA family antidote